MAVMAYIEGRLRTRRPNQLSSPQITVSPGLFVCAIPRYAIKYSVEESPNNVVLHDRPWELDESPPNSHLNYKDAPPPNVGATS